MLSENMNPLPSCMVYKRMKMLTIKDGPQNDNKERERWWCLVVFVLIPRVVSEMGLDLGGLEKGSALWWLSSVGGCHGNNDLRLSSAFTQHPDIVLLQTVYCNNLFDCSKTILNLFQTSLDRKQFHVIIEANQY